MRPDCSGCRRSVLSVDSRDIYSRSILLYGEEGYERLRASIVVVVGLGGVGSMAAEALVRAGIGRIRVIDCDIIKPTDVNRQLIALSTNIGQAKTEAMLARLRSVNPDCGVDGRKAFFHQDTADWLIGGDVDFVLDAIDSLNPKTELIRHCVEHRIGIVSSMGAAGRTDPMHIQTALLGETRVCPLARSLRRYLRSRGIALNVPVVYSTEKPSVIYNDEGAGLYETEGTYLRGRPRRSLPSISTIPAIFGLIAANFVIFSLIRR